MNDEDELLEDDFEDEYYDVGEMGMGDEDDLFEDDIDEEAEEDDGLRESYATESKIGHCRFCGAEVIVDELPDSISRDAFEDFGICLNCQWGIFMDNGGHF